MANYTSKYTGAQIDLAVASGSSVTGKIIDVSTISGSSTATIQIGSSVTANSVNATSISASSALTSSKLLTYDDLELRDGAPGGDTLVKLYDSSDDGIVDIYQNNVVAIRLSGANGQVSASGGISASGGHFDNFLTTTDMVLADKIYHEGDQDTRIEFANNQIKFIAGGNKLLDISSGHISASGGITASNITSYDDITLKDGIQGGDTLVRLHDLSDDGMVDVYQNNSVVISLDGRGGHITASGNISASGTISFGTLTATNFTASNNISASGDIILTGNISSSGKIYSYDEIILEDTNTAGDLLVRQYASSDDGVIDVYQNNAVKNRIHGNGTSYFTGGQVGIGTTTAGAALTVGGAISASGGITSSAKLTSTDEIFLKDGTLGGDTLIRGYASSDDGILDVYQNNAVKTRLHGNGVSYFNGGNVVIGGITGTEKLTVIGNISASGNITGSKINSIDEIILTDGNAGDTLVRQYASSDDGIIDVYANNAVKTRLHGNGVSYFQGGNVAIGGAVSANPLTVYGHISASSGGITGSRIASVDEIYLKDGALGGDTLIRGYASNDDGILDIYQNNAVKISLDGRGGHITASGNISSSGTVSFNTLTITNITASNNISASGNIYGTGDLYLGGLDIYGGTTKRLTLGAINGFIGDITSSGGITASAKLASLDEIFLKDGTLGGDTLVRAYASGDDGIIDVYQNNAVKTRLHGNGTSLFNGGAISASGAITASKLITYDDIILKDGNHNGDTLVKIYDSNDDGIISIYQNNAEKITLSGVDGSVSASGGITGSRIASVDEIYLKDGALGGDTLVRAYASGDDGIIDVYQNNAVKNRINGNGVSYFQGGNVAIGAAAAGAKLTVAGNISASGGVTSSAKLASLDEIILKDGTLGGDTLIRGYASSDDGIIDVYANNVVKNRINGNGVSYFQGGNVAIGGAVSANPLTVYGHISASSGGITGSRIASVDEVILKDGALGGDTLVRAYASNDDGIIDVYQNNAVKISLDGRGGHITASGDISASGTLTAGTFTIANLTASNDISASGDITAHGKVNSSDEFILKDGASGGDTLIRGYASGDDGILDVYQNNAVKARINGNGTSHFLGGNVGFGDSVPTKQLQIAGDISMSGDLFFNNTASINQPILVQGSISSSGKIKAVHQIELTDDQAAGDTLFKVHADGDDGILDVYQNNAVKNRIHGNGVSYFTGGDVAIGATATSGKKLTVLGDISASGDLYLEGDDIYNDGTKRLTLGATSKFSSNLASSGLVSASSGITSSQLTSYDDITLKDGGQAGDTLVKIYDSSDDGIIDVYENNTVKTRIAGNITTQGYITASGDISASGKIYSNDEIILKDTNQVGDTLVRAYPSGDDGIIDVYQNNAVKNRINGNGVSYFTGGDVAINTTATSGKELTVAGDISASGVIEGLNRTKVISATANLPLNVSSSGAIIVPSGGARTITLPPVATGAGVSFEIRAGSAHQHIVSQSGGDTSKKIFGHVIDNANASSAAGAGGTVIASSHKITLNSNNQIGDKLTFVGDGTNWYIDGICKDGPTAAT